MDLKRLPYLPINFFYFQFANPVRWLFLALLGLAITAGLFVSHSYIDQEYWALQIHEVADTDIETVTVKKIAHNYREIDLDFPTYKQWVNYVAGPLIPHPTPVFLFFIFQVIAWTVVLAIATLIRSRWAYAFFIAFALFIHFSDIVGVIYPNDSFRLLEFAVIAIYLGLAYAFQMNMLRWQLLARVGILMTISVALFGTAYSQGGFIALHKMSVDSFFYLVIVTLAFIFFVAKEPTNLVMIVANNRKDKRNRLGAWVIFALYMLLLLIEIIPTLDLIDLNFLPIKDLGIRPIFLLAISAVFTVFTSQNQYHTVKRLFSSNIAYSFLLLCWAIISLSFIFLVFSEADYMFIYAIERLTAEVFLGVAIMHIFFIYTNHFELLKARVNLYYVMAQGRTFGFIVVALFGLMAVVFAEGKDNWRSFRLFVHNLAVQHADHDLILGNSVEATSSYELAREMSPVSVKANYNLASLLITDPQNVNIALDAYEKATNQTNYPYARINAANLLAVNNSNENALKVLQDGTATKEINPYLHSNLGYLYYRMGMSDSAILQFKKALNADLNLSSTYTNLSLLYQENDKTEEAREFVQAAITLREPSEAAITNTIQYKLQHPEIELNISNDKIDNTTIPLQYNYLLSLIAEDKQEAAQQLSKKLRTDATASDIQMIDTYLLFQQDSISEAMSKALFLTESRAPISANVNFLLGAAFYEKGVPEMAQKYFKTAHELGLSKGKLYEAKMNIDLGNADSAQFQFSELRVEDERLWEECSKELALLLYSRGQASFAQLEWDMSLFNQNERMRLSIYADSIQSFIIAEDNFIRMLQADSAYTAPYLEMGRIYNYYQDDVAILNLKTGLSVDPSNIPIKLELARAHIIHQQLDTAQEVLNSISNEDSYHIEKGISTALLQLAKEDTSGISTLEDLNKKQPLNQEIILILCEEYRKRGLFDEGNLLITEALAYNTENADYWYYYAVFSKAWNLLEDSGFGAAKAIELSNDQERKLAISEEFVEELKLISN